MARYDIDPERSHVGIVARSTLHPLTVAASGLEGWLDLDGNGDGDGEPDGRLRLAVDRLSTGNRLEDHELRRRIDARRFPRIDGILTGAQPLDDGNLYAIAGDITFHGVTRSYKDEMAVEHITPDTIRLTGQCHFDLRDFGISPPRVLFVRIDPQVEVEVAITAVLAAQPGHEEAN